MSSPTARTASPNAFEPDETWVPADRRWLGLDRRTVLPTVIVFALAALLAGVLPSLNAAVSYNDSVRAGDVIELDGGVVFVPEPGWGITSGVRRGNGPKVGRYPPTATVVNGEVTVTVRSASFDGDANALLDQIKLTTDALRSRRGIRIEGERRSISTDSGAQGVMTGVTSAQATGLIAVFVLDGQGVAAVVTGPTGAVEVPDEAVLRMIKSIHTEGPKR